jgi:hypothetical protein
MSSSTPPIPDGGPWPAEYATGNGASADAPSASVQRLVILGYITAVTMPPVGFVLGLVLAVRATTPNSKRGTWIIAVSIVAAIAWVLALALGLMNPNSNTSS